MLPSGVERQALEDLADHIEVIARTKISRETSISGKLFSMAWEIKQMALQRITLSIDEVIRLLEIMRAQDFTEATLVRSPQGSLSISKSHRDESIPVSP